MAQIHRVLFIGKLLKNAPLLATLTLLAMAGMFWAYANELEKVLNVLQAAAILLALFVLALLALKDESLRYKSKPESFRYRAYQDLLSAAKNHAGTTRAPKPFDVYDHESLVSRSILENWSTQEKLIRQGVAVTDVHFDVDRSQRYELPWFLQSDGTTLLRERFNTLSGNDFNGATLSVFDLQFHTSSNHPPDRPRMVYNMRFGNYFEYLLTNVIPEASVSGVDIRSWLESEKNHSLNPLRFSQAENHLGISCMFCTADGYVLLGHRRQQNTVFKGEWSPSVSGASNLETCARQCPQPHESPNHSTTLGDYTALDFFMNEAQEEILQVLPQLLGPTPNVVRDHLAQLRFVGATRELIRLGKPEAFFAMRLSHCLQDVQKLCVATGQQLDGVHYFVGGPGSENLGFLAIHIDQFFDHLTFDQLGNKPARRNPYLKQQNSWVQWMADHLHFAALHLARKFLTRQAQTHQWRPVLMLSNPQRPGRSVRFVLSESCVVKMLLMRRAGI